MLCKTTTKITTKRLKIKNQRGDSIKQGSSRIICFLEESKVGKVFMLDIPSISCFYFEMLCYQTTTVLFLRTHSYNQSGHMYTMLCMHL